MSGTKRPADWDLIEVDYRAGTKTLRQIAEENGITHGAVNKRAKVKGWTRDLAAKIKAAADAKVSKAVVSTEVSKQRLVTEQQVVEANAEMQTRIRLEHRKDIGRTRDLFRSLLEELETASDKHGQKLIDILIEMTNEPDEDEDDIARRARLERMRKQRTQLLDGSNRIDSAKRLTEMLEKLVRMEREAFGIDNNKVGDGGYEDLLRRVIEQAGS